MRQLRQQGAYRLHHLCEQSQTPIYFLAGGLLLFAAGLKFLYLVNMPSLPDDPVWQRWAPIAQIQVEIFWSVWLLARMSSKFTQFASALLFALFGVSSAYHAALGRDSCGCFGDVKVNPWMMLALDAFLVGAFLSLPLTPKGRRDRANLKLTRFVGVLFIWLPLAVPVVIFSSGPRLATVSDNGEIADNETVVLLDPQQWAGNRFALVKYIDVGSIFARGRWHLLFVRPGCPDCEETLKQLLSASSPKTSGDDSRWGIIELPPLTEETSGLILSSQTDILLGRLTRAKSWLAKVPFTIIVVDGIVFEWAPGIPMRK